MNYSGYKRPTVKTDKQYLPTDPVDEAEEGKIIYTVNSKSAGRVEGWKTQDAGKESNVVEAVAKFGYKFVKWSDGVTTATVRETPPKEFTPRFSTTTFSICP